MPKIVRITTVSNSMELLKGQLAFMRQYYDVVGVSSGKEMLNEIAVREGIRVFEVKMTRTISPFKDVRSVWQLYSLMIREKPDIVHTHTPKAGTLGMLAAWLCKVPFRLHTVAGLPLVESGGIKRLLLETVERITYSFATRVYPNSSGLNDFILSRKYCKPSKLKIIGNGSSNGIDSNYFSRTAVSSIDVADVRKRYAVQQEDFVFVFIGRLVSDKGINELVKVFDNVFRNHAKVKLLLVGHEERKLDPLHKKTISTMINHPAIILTGSQSDVRPYLALSDVLVLPSYREGLPNVPLQACAMGVPCIVTDINGCNEIINDGYNGILVPKKDSEALQCAMERMLNEKELYLKLKSNSRDSVINKYDQFLVWEKIKEEYDKYSIES